MTDINININDKYYKKYSNIFYISFVIVVINMTFLNLQMMLFSKNCNLKRDIDILKLLSIKHENDDEEKEVIKLLNN